MYTRIIRPILFLFHPDTIHKVCIAVGKRAQESRFAKGVATYLWAPKKDRRLEVSLWNKTFSHPVGLAAGFDKNGEIIKLLSSVGLGHIEIGAITAKEYKGNPRPWTTRVPEDNSLIVNYGLKNEGVEKIGKRIEHISCSIPLIANVAKTNDKTIQGEATIEDYIHTIQAIDSYVDIIDINISCPNTGDKLLLCEDMNLLELLLSRIAIIRSTVSSSLLLKIKPDISQEKIRQIIDLVEKYGCIDGFVATNLSRNRSLLSKEMEDIPGGISGKPISNDATNTIKTLYQYTQGRYPIIGCGGVFSGEDAYEKIKAGASLIQILTGFIYKGPGLIKKIHKELLELLEKDGYDSIQEAIGVDAKK